MNAASCRHYQGELNESLRVGGGICLGIHSQTSYNRVNVLNLLNSGNSWGSQQPHKALLDPWGSLMPTGHEGLVQQGV